MLNKIKKNDRTITSRSYQDSGHINAIRKGSALVLVMLFEWAAAKSTNSLDDRLVIEMKTKLEADGKL